VVEKLLRVFALAAKHYASSLTLWLISGAFLIPGLVFTELSDPWSPNLVIPVLIAGVFSHFVLGVVLWVGGKTVLQPSRRQTAGWKEVVLVFFLAGALRGFAIGFALDGLGAGETNFLVRVSTSVLLVVFSFTVFSYGAQLWRQYRSKRFDLLQSIAVGESFITLGGIAAGEYRPLALGNLEDDVQKARAQTTLALQSIRQKVRSKDFDSANAQEIFERSDNAWRMLSHKAWEAAAPNVPRITMLELAKTLASSKPISLLVLSSGPLYGFTRIFDSLTFFEASSGAMIWLVLILAIASVTNLLATRAKGWGFFVLVTGFIAIQLVAFLVGILLLDGLAAQSEIGFVSLVSSTVAIGMGLPPALERSGQVVIAQLEQRLNNSAMENLKSQGEMFVLAQRIGSYLHSEVRGDFLRHSLALREALEKADSEQAEKILDQLDHVVSSINLEESEQSPIENLALFLKNWSGVIEIEHNLDQVAISPSFQRSVQTIVIEAVNNAVRHGHASRVEIKFSQTASSLEIQIDSNSKTFTDNPVQGLGTKTLDRLAPGGWSWQFIETPGAMPFVRLRVELTSQKI
jgi:signal transduction histidine kinase